MKWEKIIGYTERGWNRNPSGLILPSLLSSGKHRCKHRWLGLMFSAQWVAESIFATIHSWTKKFSKFSRCLKPAIRIEKYCKKKKSGGRPWGCTLNYRSLHHSKSLQHVLSVCPGRWFQCANRIGKSHHLGLALFFISQRTLGHLLMVTQIQTYRNLMYKWQATLNML